MKMLGKINSTVIGDGLFILFETNRKYLNFAYKAMMQGNNSMQR